MPEKAVSFHGSSLDVLRALDVGTRRRLGFQIRRVQAGLEPDDWKPMPGVGPGAAEIRVRDERGAFRAIYVARFREAIHILHAFEKKTAKTTLSDLRIARDRYRALVRERTK
jgi:phage-related protein